MVVMGLEATKLQIQVDPADFARLPTQHAWVLKIEDVN